MKFTICTFQKGENNYVAICPELESKFSSGSTIIEAKENLMAELSTMSLDDFPIITCMSLGEIMENIPEQARDKLVGVAYNNIQLPLGIAVE